jgi:hypothetical protein
MREFQAALGHKTITQAARYSHLSPQHTLAVVDRIADTPETLNMHLYMHQASKARKAVTSDAKQ